MIFETRFPVLIESEYFLIGEATAARDGGGASRLM
jgi:hypothetical protein